MTRHNPDHDHHHDGQMKTDNDGPSNNKRRRHHRRIHQTLILFGSPRITAEQQHFPYTLKHFHKQTGKEGLREGMYETTQRATKPALRSSTGR